MKLTFSHPTKDEYVSLVFDNQTCKDNKILIQKRDCDNMGNEIIVNIHDFYFMLVKWFDENM